MQIEIIHVTEYLYSNNVFFEPHYLRLKPKSTPHSSLLSFDVDIQPQPQGISEYNDVENNAILFCWFEDLHKSLKVNVRSLIEVVEYNPFNFLIHPSEYLVIPFIYDEQTNHLLQVYRQTKNLSVVMQKFLNDNIKKTDHQTLEFLTELTKTIHKEFIVETREEGIPHDIQYTFDQKRGSCRDLVWMQIHLLRNIGIAARFVSGYFYLKADNPQFELHAWVEAYLPGAGWVGFDPSHGMITGAYHIPLASSAFHENTMPISGSIRGEASSELKHDLKISVVNPRDNG